MMTRNSITSVLLAAFLGVSLGAPAYAANEGSSSVKTSKKAAKKKIYKEGEFVVLVRNKSKKQVAEMLGDPVSKMQGSSKPSGADSATMAMGRIDPSRRDNVEVWYYKNIVSYDPKHTFSKVELTFMNDRCQNVAYFNER